MYDGMKLNRKKKTNKPKDNMKVRKNGREQECKKVYSLDYSPHSSSKDVLYATHCIPLSS
jgi:hypothetical protein